MAACGRRLANGLTWDGLLSIVGTLYFSFKQLSGPWSVDLGAAATRLRSRRSLSVLTQRSKAGYSSISSPAGMRPETYMYSECISACGACGHCLVAQQLMRIGSRMLSDTSRQKIKARSGHATVAQTTPDVQGL